MPDTNFAIFDTAIGFCGIVWGARGLTGVQLPKKDEASTRSRVQQRYPSAVEAAPLSQVQDAIDGIRALLKGEPRDLTGIAIDNSRTPDFNAKVYAITRQVPPGKTITYGEIATQLGDKLLARDVGQALGENPCPLVMPCHRVLAANGKPGGFSAAGGVVTKLKLLSIEGAQPGGPTLFDDLPLAVKN
ncbi:MAG TPA: methylated-DNA--[protein]-cysteine S-methyltransferase [Pseudolabrys sp.]